jgi:hypothetical protein
VKKGRYWSILPTVYTILPQHRIVWTFKTGGGHLNKYVDIQHEVCHWLSGTTPDFTATWTTSVNSGTNALIGTIITLNTFMCPNLCVISNNDNYVLSPKTKSMCTSVYYLCSSTAEIRYLLDTFSYAVQLQSHHWCI